MEMRIYYSIINLYCIYYITIMLSVKSFVVYSMYLLTKTSPKIHCNDFLTYESIYYHNTNARY